jgi:hypothetical protein
MGQRMLIARKHLRRNRASGAFNGWCSDNHHQAAKRNLGKRVRSGCQERFLAIGLLDGAVESLPISGSNQRTKREQ